MEPRLTAALGRPQSLLTTCHLEWCYLKCDQCNEENCFHANTQYHGLSVQVSDTYVCDFSGWSSCLRYVDYADSTFSVKRSSPVNDIAHLFAFWNLIRLQNLPKCIFVSWNGVLWPWKPEKWWYKVDGWMETLSCWDKLDLWLDGTAGAVWRSVFFVCFVCVFVPWPQLTPKLTVGGFTDFNVSSKPPLILA